MRDVLSSVTLVVDVVHRGVGGVENIVELNPSFETVNGVVVKTGSEELPVSFVRKVSPFIEKLIVVEGKSFRAAGIALIDLGARVAHHDPFEIDLVVIHY